MGYSWKKRRWLFFILFPGVWLLLSAAVMWLWNYVLVPVAPVKPLNYWQALGILVLSRILFGGFRWRPRPQHGPSNPWREKWQGLSPEEKQRLKTEWKRRCEGKK